MALSPARAWRDGGGDTAVRLLHLRADPLDTLDRESGPANFLGDRTDPMATSGQLLVSKAASRRQQEQRSQPVAGVGHLAYCGCIVVFCLMGGGEI